ncbi:MAG: hypothetical protein JWO09_771 [Bacteroidetes bacterium]|nr:hypothetical protein [Bacteroidota bacterium]
MGNLLSFIKKIQLSWRKDAEPKKKAFVFLKKFRRRQKKSPAKNRQDLTVFYSEQLLLYELQTQFPVKKNSSISVPANFQHNLPGFTLNICEKERPLPHGMAKMLDLCKNSIQPTSI